MRCAWHKHDRRERTKRKAKCAHCGEIFTHTKSQKRRFCSPACLDASFGGPVPVRLERLIKRAGPDDCWTWKGTINKGGYGTLSVDGKTKLAHRLAYIEYKGKIGRGLLVMHSCDNPPCCNPAHLSLGTHVDNMRDMAMKNRGATSRTEWLQRVEMVATVRDGYSVAQVAAMYQMSPSAVSRWVRLFDEGDVFGYDQLL